MHKIIIIGAGELGSRHLQSLVNVAQKIEIEVVDTSLESLENAKKRFNDVNSHFKVEISFKTKISDLSKNIDIAIIATNSKVRKLVIQQLVSHATVKYLILEKVLFTKVIDYDEISQLLRINKVKTWVNCPRRMMQVYQNLKKEITGTIQLSVTGSNWGLGCNGIHFLDLFAFLSNSKKIVLTNNLIDETIIESKRKGFDEFTGTITGESENNTFQITSLSSGNSPISVTIMTQNTCYQIQEGPTGTLIKRNLENQLYLEEQKFSMPFQSQLTNIVVDQLIENGDCNLTTLEESSNLHLEFLSNFISLLQNKNKTIDECLIT